MVILVTLAVVVPIVVVLMTVFHLDLLPAIAVYMVGSIIVGSIWQVSKTILGRRV